MLEDLIVFRFSTEVRGFSSEVLFEIGTRRLVQKCKKTFRQKKKIQNVHLPSLNPKSSKKLIWKIINVKF